MLRLLPMSRSAMLTGITGANSLETLHNWMHTRTGGGGHMSDPIASGRLFILYIKRVCELTRIPSAFDPIFMLHHTNVS